MSTLNSFRKTALVSFVVILASGSCNICKSESAHYEVANPKTGLLGKAHQITILTVPYFVKSKAYGQLIKPGMIQLADKK